MSRRNRLIGFGLTAALTLAMNVAADDSVVGDGDPGTSTKRIEHILSSVDDPLSAFGPDYVLKVIGSAEFQPLSSSATFENGGNGYFYPTSIDSYRAQMDVPLGSEIALACVFIYDNTDVGEAFIRFLVIELGDLSGNPGAVLLSTAGSGNSATPGYQLLCMNPDPDTLIQGNADVDGDGDSAYVWYLLTYESTMTIGSPGPDLRCGGGLDIYRRTVSPAPATATFGDVPTDYWAFRFIEALADSGITGGCGGGDFCPESNITRGEMAVFMAAALGLHWPE